MSAGLIATTVPVFGLALWLGLYLLARDPRSPRLRWTGLGLVAYALALGCGAFAGAAPPGTAETLARLRWPLQIVPALCWAGALLDLVPEETDHRARLARLWRVATPGLVLLVGAAAFATDLLVGVRGASPGGRGAPVAVALAVSVPLLAAIGLVRSGSRSSTAGVAAGGAALFGLFLALSTGLLVVGAGRVPLLPALLLVGVDIVALGLALARFDALEQGETLLPDMLRSFDAAALAALLFGGQVALAMALGGGPTAPLLALLLGTVAAAVASTTFAGRLGALLDRFAFERRPGLSDARAELRAAAEALARLDPAFDPAAVDEAEFARLTRRALSHFGDLPRLAASPLTRLPAVDHRLAARGAPDDALERAVELKALLAESVARLRPRTGERFGTAAEWRHYNALHFPYVVGLKPYGRRAAVPPTDPAARAALDWFRDTVPERTLHNWQTAAARLVARDLRERGGAGPIAVPPSGPAGAPDGAAPPRPRAAVR